MQNIDANLTTINTKTDHLLKINREQSVPVSYTHLDVYKRQCVRNARLVNYNTLQQERI